MEDMGLALEGPTAVDGFIVEASTEEEFPTLSLSS
jgi:hypothetical protein